MGKLIKFIVTAVHNLMRNAISCKCTVYSPHFTTEAGTVQCICSAIE